MTKQLQVPVPEISPEASMAIGLFGMQVTHQVRQITRELSPKLHEKQSTLELELYALSLCSCIFGIVCEHQGGNIPLKDGQAGRVQEKLKQLAIDLVVNELQDQIPHPSQN